MELLEDQKTNSNQEIKYQRAKKRIAAEKKYYGKVMKYVVFMVFFAALNYYSNKWSTLWFLWVAFGWGIGLVLKGINVFGFNPFISRDWEKRKIAQFMKEESESNKRWN